MSDLDVGKVFDELFDDSVFGMEIKKHRLRNLKSVFLVFITMGLF